MSTALERLKQRLRQESSVSSVSPVSQESVRIEPRARARGREGRDPEEEVTKAMINIDIPPENPENPDLSFQGFLTEVTDRTDTTPLTAQRAAMHRELAIVVQDLLAEGRKPGEIRRMFALSWADINRIRKERW